MSTAILTFEAADARWGVPLSNVDEIVSVAEIVHLPLAPEAVAGMISVHGSPVGAVDFAKLTGGTSRPVTCAIVLNGCEAALLVDTLSHIVVVDEVVSDSEPEFPWIDGRAGSAYVINTARVLEAIA